MILKNYAMYHVSKWPYDEINRTIIKQGSWIFGKGDKYFTGLAALRKLCCPIWDFNVEYS